MAFKQFLFSQRLLKHLALNPCRFSYQLVAIRGPGEGGCFRRFIYSYRMVTPRQDIQFFPSGGKILENLSGLDVVKERDKLSAKNVIFMSQFEKLKQRLRQIEEDYLSYPEFLRICADESLSNDQGIESAKLLDESGAVIVLGNTVFLRPEQVMKAIQGSIPVATAHRQSDPRLKEFQELEKEKEAIDKKAESLARRELWCGLGFLTVQTAGFMRLTFWDLNWDVMEPICFFVTSTYLMGGYAFYMRTWKEPSFQGFFQSRFAAKQRRLMKLRNFDSERYNELKRERL